MPSISRDTADLLFRAFFSLIFIGLGLEHIFSDELIQKLMPLWVPYRRLISGGCGVWLVWWGSFIILGWKVDWAARALGSFLVVVTLLVHVPGVLQVPPELTSDCVWLWNILQRSNLVKNLCLLGGCFHFLHHEVGRFSVQAWLERRSLRVSA